MPAEPGLPGEQGWWPESPQCPAGEPSGRMFYEHAHKTFTLSACPQVESNCLSRAKVPQVLAQPLTTSTLPVGLGHPESPSLPQLHPEVLPQGLCTSCSPG